MNMRDYAILHLGTNVLHFTATVESSIMSIPHTLKWLGNGL